MRVTTILKMWQAPVSASMGLADTGAGDQFHTRAVGFRTTANDLQKKINALTSGNSLPPGEGHKVLGYVSSITVLRALSGERSMLKPALATVAVLVVCSGLAQGHERRQCHTHLFEDGTPAAERHSEAAPGCILQGNRMYVPSECYVPKPSAECEALMRRAADYQQAAQRSERPRTAGGASR